MGTFDVVIRIQGFIEFFAYAVGGGIAHIGRIQGLNLGANTLIDRHDIRLFSRTILFTGSGQNK
jgi:hypothetical protein